MKTPRYLARDTITALMIGIAVLVLEFAPAAVLAAPAPAPAAPQNSGAIGQIVPAGGIIFLNGPPGAIVREIKVRAGQDVISGTVLMILDGEAIKAELELATTDLQGARNLATSTNSAQSLTVELAKQRLDETTRQLEAYRSIGAQGTATGELARLQSAQNQARLALEIEQSRLRATNAETSRAVAAATTRLALARAAGEIRAPSAGTVLKIDRRVGQSLGPEPAIQMADLRTMYVISQVYEGDLLKLRPGMKATIRSATLAQPLTGVVDEVGRLVDTRARLGEIRIKLDSAEPASRLVGMEVEVVIAR